MPLTPMPPMPMKRTGPCRAVVSCGVPGLHRQPPNLLVCARRRHLLHQVSEPVRGIEPADGAGRRRHGGKPLRHRGEAGQLGGEPPRGERILGQLDGAAGRFEHAGIGELVLIEGVRQGDEDRRPADRGQFGDGGRPRPRHDQVARRQTRRQMAKRRYFGGNCEVGRRRAPGSSPRRGAENFCIWQRAPPPYRLFRASLGHKPIRRGRYIGLLGLPPAEGTTSSRA